MSRQLEAYWFEPNDLIPDRDGLWGLLDDVYTSLLLLQGISDYCRTSFGRPLIGEDLTQANQCVRAILGEPIAEQMVAATIMQSMTQRIVVSMAHAPTFSFSRGSDPGLGKRVDGRDRDSAPCRHGLRAMASRRSELNTRRIHMAQVPEQVQNALNNLLEAGTITKEQLATIIQAADDPQVLAVIVDKLISAGADKISPLLNAEDYYREGAGNFDAKWPIQVPLPCSFEALDRKTRFFVLFQEWSRRELQGVTALGCGDTAEATTIFEECLARGRQLAVNELVARSYEDLMRTADRLNDLEAARRYSQEAVNARSENG